MIPHKWGIKTADLMVSDGGLEMNIHHVVLMRDGLVASFKCRRRENSSSVTMVANALDLSTLNMVIFTHLAHILCCD